MGHRHSTFDLDARIRGIAARQLGLITSDQAKASGVDKHALARRRNAGALIPVFPGVLRLAPFAPNPQQHALGAALAVPGAVIAATSAAAIHQMPLSANAATAGNAVVSVGLKRLVRVRGITAVRHTVAPPSRKWFTSRVATPAATLLLLPRFVDAGTVERCLDHCLAHRLTTVTRVRSLVEGLPSRAVHGRRFLLGLLDARSTGIGHRSGMEQQVGRWLKHSGLSGWVRNHRVDVGYGDDVEVDFGWQHERIALEVSPFFTHGSRAKQDRDAERRRLLVVNDWRVVEAADRDLRNERDFARIIATLRTMGAT